jgi:hypothetical protein
VQNDPINKLKTVVKSLKGLQIAIIDNRKRQAKQEAMT